MCSGQAVLQQKMQKGDMGQCHWQQSVNTERRQFCPSVAHFLLQDFGQLTKKVLNTLQRNSN